MGPFTWPHLHQQEMHDVYPPVALAHGSGETSSDASLNARLPHSPESSDPLSCGSAQGTCFLLSVRLTEVEVGV